MIKHWKIQKKKIILFNDAHTTLCLQIHIPISYILIFVVCNNLIYKIREDSRDYLQKILNHKNQNNKTKKKCFCLSNNNNTLVVTMFCAQRIFFYAA